MEEKYLSVNEVCKFMPFWSKRTIRQYAARKKLPCVRMGGRVYFREEELVKFLKENVIKEWEGNYGKAKPTE